MVITEKDFIEIKDKHSRYGSWAIWSYEKKNEKSVNEIYENINSLHSNYVIIGLNISSLVKDWSNFRGGRHDRKLKYAFNNSKIKGSYMTDLFKDIVNPVSTNFYKYILDELELISENVKLFCEEMKNVKISNETKFIIMGTKTSNTGKLFQKYFSCFFPDNVIIYHRHYSSRGTDKAWVESVWKDLGIRADYEDEVRKYK
jgi:hypothetical protein